MLARLALFAVVLSITILVATPALDRTVSVTSTKLPEDFWRLPWIAGTSTFTPTETRTRIPGQLLGGSDIDALDSE